jgi:ribosomal protein S18 acetylase RimI-like enzyme
MTARVRRREATIEDSEQLAGVHTRSWQVAYRGQLPDALLDGLDPRDRVAGWRLRLSQDGPATTLVAIDDRSDRIVGFVVVGPSRDEEQHPTNGGEQHPTNGGEQTPTNGGEQHRRVGEVYAIYVDPPWWGRRIGTDLVRAGMEMLRADGFDRATLWVLDGNERTHRFYERHGWRQDDERRIDEIRNAHPDVGDAVSVEVVERRYAITLRTPPIQIR